MLNFDILLLAFIAGRLSDCPQMQIKAYFCPAPQSRYLAGLVLREFGWDVSSSDFLPLIDACRLIVNVYKHGNGQSLRDLAERYPRYLNLSTSCDGERSDGFLKHEWLSVSSADFDAIAGLRAFWVPSPERSYKVEVTLAPNWQGAPAPKPSNENPIPQ